MYLQGVILNYKVEVEKCGCSDLGRFGSVDAVQQMQCTTHIFKNVIRASQEVNMHLRMLATDQREYF